MRRSIARRSAIQMSMLSILGVVIMAVMTYQAIGMWQTMRHEDTLSRAASGVEQILLRNRELPVADMWARVDELLLSLVNVRAKVQAVDGQVVYGPQILLGQVTHKVTRQYPLNGLGGSMPMSSLELAMDVSEDRRFLNFMAWLFSGMAGVWAIVVLLLSSTLARLELKPLIRFSRDIAQFDPSNLSARIHHDQAPDELSPVIEQFNHLMGKVGHYHEQLRSFNSNVAHELNTPLSSLTVSHELLLRERHLDHAQVVDALHSHLEELQRMNRIIQSMLFLSHVGQGQTPEFETLSLSALVHTVMDYMEPLLEEHQLRWVLTGDALVPVDAELIKRALSNLLSNAVRYADVDSTIRIEIDPKAEGRCAQVMVCNQGVSISAEHIPHLFEPFYRVDQSRTESHRNHGLGLAIVAAIARLHGGEPIARCDGLQVSVGFTVSRPSALDG
ncbi:ATP-binding protein [Limnobacter humi]|uniref:histidine kinase n=1 Tax=Limnobacter humi TaxID=1778671 RepID=A0ABT1WHA6_9BURK|nr:ATP-binding protein [Limnobacter humi]MCQ8896789.1 ATP-binding protein [Limnobacter humi]